MTVLPPGPGPQFATLSCVVDWIQASLDTAARRGLGQPAAVREDSPGFYSSFLFLESKFAIIYFPAQSKLI